MTSFKGLLFTRFLWDTAEAAAHLSKVFQAEFLTVTTAAAVRKFEMQCLNMKSSDGPRVKAFLTEVGEGNMFRDIAITIDDIDLSQFQKVKLTVVDEVCQSTAERFQYLFDDPVIKASSVFDPDTWPGDPEELASYGDDKLVLEKI